MSQKSPKRPQHDQDGEGGEILSEKNKALRLEAQINNLREQLQKYSDSCGIRDPKTLECTIQLADALGEYAPNWQEEQKSPTERKRNPAGMEITDERIALYRTAVDNSPDGEFRIKAKLALASLSDSGGFLHRELIEECSKHFGRESKETLDCVRQFVDSGLCEKQDHELVYGFFKIRKKNNGDATDISCALADFYRDLGWAEFELEMCLDELEYRRRSEPLWFLDEISVLLDIICFLQAELSHYAELATLLSDLLESYRQMPSASKNARDIDDLEERMILIEAARDKMHDIMRQSGQRSPENLKEEALRAIDTVFERSGT